MGYNKISKLLPETKYRASMIVLLSDGFCLDKIK